MISQDKIQRFLKESERVFSAAFAAHNRNESFSESVRFKMHDDEPEWKLVVTWDANDASPNILVKQRAI